jgi:hypothetical protein
MSRINRRIPTQQDVNHRNWAKNEEVNLHQFDSCKRHTSVCLHRMCTFNSWVWLSRMDLNIRAPSQAFRDQNWIPLFTFCTPSKANISPHRMKFDIRASCCTFYWTHLPNETSSSQCRPFATSRESKWINCAISLPDRDLDPTMMNEVALGSLGSDLPNKTLTSALAPFLAELALYLVYLTVPSIPNLFTISQLECHLSILDQPPAKAQLRSCCIERERVIFGTSPADPKSDFKSLNFNTFYHFDGAQGCF